MASRTCSPDGAATHRRRIATGTQAPALCPQSKACHSAVHAGRSVASRHVRLQAGDRKARGRASGVCRSQVAAKHQNGADAIAVFVQAIRAVRQIRQRDLSARRRIGRRHLFHPFDAHRHSRTCRCDDDDERRAFAAESPEHGIVAGLRSGHRESEPARIRRDESARPAAQQAGQLGQRVFARCLHRHLREHSRHAARSHPG